MLAYMWNDLRVRQIAWMRKHFFPIAPALSFGVAVAVYLFASAKAPQLKPQPAKYSLKQEMSGQVPSDITPGQTALQTAPVSQHMTGRDLIDKGQLGVLQKGVSASQANHALEVQTLKDFPGFDETSLTVQRGEIISLTFRNNSAPTFGYQHNWVLVSPDAVGAAKIKAYRGGLQQDWTPKGPDILARTDLLKSGENQTITFRAPSEAGDYPFLCTFPGHGNIEQGTLHVK
jgi:azurin